MLTGGIDEYFTRTDSTGTANFLTDALGSTIELTDNSGSALAQYKYEPFGNTAATGTSTNPYQYAGRENDGDGLYFLRARYYSPMLQRFISEDPAGLSGGLNLYIYAHNSPADEIDPFGLWSPEAHDALIRHALAPCGVSDGEIHQIQQASRSFDSATGEDPNWAYVHSMSNAAAHQSAQDAIQQRNEFIDSQLNIARLAWQSGDTSYALNQFGWGIHPVMDFTSPAHTLPNGDPIPWCAPFGCKGNRVHSPNDWWGRERTCDITPQDYREEDEAIRDAYEFITGTTLSCRKQQ